MRIILAPCNIWFQFAFDHNNAVFYVDGKHAAAALQNCTRRIVMPNDLKVTFFYFKLLLYTWINFNPNMDK